MKGFKIWARLGMIALAVVTTAPAHAGLTYSGYSVLNNQNVTVTFADGHTEYGGAGQITLQNVIEDGVSKGNLNTWCIDLFDTLQSSGGFNFKAWTTPTLPGVEEKIAALIVNGSKSLSTYDVSAALQVAIWDVNYGRTSITVVADNPHVNSLADEFVQHVDDGSWTNNAGASLETIVGFSNGAANQSQARVPEPLSAALLGVGALGIAMVRKRKQNSAAAI